MTEKDVFFKGALAINVYIVLEDIVNSSWRKGGRVTSENLYEKGFSIKYLIENEFIEEIPKIFPFEKEIIGGNINSVYTRCPDCFHVGINAPLDKICGNCNYPIGQTYYDAETMHFFLKKKGVFPDLTDDDIVFKSIFVDGFGFSQTIYIYSDFIDVKMVCNDLFIGYFDGGGNVILNGYLKENVLPLKNALIEDILEKINGAILYFNPIHKEFVINYKGKSYSKSTAFDACSACFRDYCFA